MMHHSRTLGIVEMDKTVRKRLTPVDREQILKTCDDALDRYFSRNLK